MRAAWAVLAALLLVGSWSLAAVAASPDDEARAEELVKQGLELARAKKFREALKPFEEANRLLPHPEIQHNIARAYEELGEYRAAYQWFSRALKQDYVYATEGREHLAKIEQELRRTHARVTVRAVPTNAKVVLRMSDGAEETYLSTPFQTWAPAGATTLVVTNPDFEKAEVEVELAPGEERDIPVELKVIPKMGFLRIQASVPGASIYVDEVLVGTAPMESIAHPAGLVQVKVKARGYKPDVQSVVVKENEVASVTALLESDGSEIPVVDDDPGVPNWLGPTLIGVGAVALVTAIVFHAQAFSTNDEANQVPLPAPGQDPNPDDEKRYNDLFNEAKDYQTYAQISYVAAGAFVVGGVLCIVLDEDGPEESAGSGVSFTPQLVATPDTVGAGALLRF
ncbi:MAG: PEGA domain-containing protein, partial [Myxococcales bacterium]|nr:PEGA domain-containing protein [Myxococcales bacterium]